MGTFTIEANGAEGKKATFSAITFDVLDNTKNASAKTQLLSKINVLKITVKKELYEALLEMFSQFLEIESMPPQRCYLKVIAQDPKKHTVSLTYNNEKDIEYLVKYLENNGDVTEEMASDALQKLNPPHSNMAFQR